MSRQLASSGKIGSVKIKNRMVMAPMGDLTANPDGTVSDKTVAYYSARAKGGIGLIITGIVRINNEDGTAGPNQLSLADDKYIPGFKRLVDEVHSHGAKIFPQIQHSGRQGVAALTGSDHVLAPSAIPSAVMQQPTKALTLEQIKTLIGQFGDTARRAMEAGCDGVEIHAAHGYLIEQFLSPFSNKREDEYGGSFDNRMRFLREIIQDVKDKTKDDFAISVRLSVDEFIDDLGINEEHIDLEEGIKIAKAIEKEGVDALNVSCGTYESMNFAIEPVSVEPGWRRDFIKAVKDEINLPVIAVAKFRTPEMAEEFLNDGVLDFVSFGRPLLADPEFPNKAMAKEDLRVNRCISCLFCFDELNKGSHVVCAVNPRTGFESDYAALEKSDVQKKVAIVGAGPAGLAAAVAAKENGHFVHIFEAGDDIGGQVRIGMNPPKKDQLGWMLEDTKRLLDELGIEVQMNQKMTPEDLKAQGFDVVLLGIGAEAITPNIPGVDQEHVYSVEDVLEGRVSLEEKTVAVIGSGLTGLEVAELLQTKGNKTFVVEMQDSLAPGAYAQNFMDVMSRMKPELSEYLTSQKLVAIREDKIELEDMKTQQLTTKAVDAVVLSVGYKANEALLDSFKDVADTVEVIGDAKDVKNIGLATRSGYQTALKL